MDEPNVCFFHFRFLFISMLTRDPESLEIVSSSSGASSGSSSSSSGDSGCHPMYMPPVSSPVVAPRIMIVPPSSSTDDTEATTTPTDVCSCMSAMKSALRFIMSTMWNRQVFPPRLMRRTGLLSQVGIAPHRRTEIIARLRQRFRMPVHGSRTVEEGTVVQTHGFE